MLEEEVGDPCCCTLDGQGNPTWVLAPGLLFTGFLPGLSSPLSPHFLYLYNSGDMLCPGPGEIQSVVCRLLSLCTPSVAQLRKWGEMYPEAPGLGLSLFTNLWAQAGNCTVALSSSVHWVES